MKKFLSLLLVAVLVSAMFVVPVSADDAAAEATNVALNKEYTISGNGKNYGHTGSVTDGIICEKPFSGDAAASSDERKASWFCFYYHIKESFQPNVNAPDGIGYIIIDLEEEYALSSLRVFLIDKPTWGSPIPDAVNAYVSLDGVAYEEVGTFGLECEEDSPFWSEIEVECTARYLKIEVDLGSTEGYLGEVEAYGVKPGSDSDDEEDGEDDDEETTGPIYVEKVVSSYKDYTTSPLFRQSEAYDWSVDAPIAYPDDALNEEMTNGVVADIANWDAFWADNTPIIGFHGNTPAFEEDGVSYPSYKDVGYAWIKVDLGAVESVNKLSANVHNMDVSSSVTSVSFAVSEDGEEWTVVGTVETPDMGNVEAVLELDEAVNAKFVEYRFVSGAYWMFVSEVKAISTVERNIVKDATVNITASETAAANSDGAVTVFKAGDSDRVVTSDEANLRYSWFIIVDEEGKIVSIGNNLVKASENKQGFITEATVPAGGALIAFYYNASGAAANQTLMDVYNDVLLVANNGAAIYNTYISVESDYVLELSDEAITITNTAKGGPVVDDDDKEDIEAKMKELLGEAPADAKVDYVIEAPESYEAGDEITVTVTVKNITAENGIHVAAFKLLYDNE
ncbi:MAG: discoidin domain-containing protein, partial [Clostridia bacterium]|nr:discoidin domain-containing protein [Clostridia bacterium]